jgi:hypothetical protein
MPHHPSIGQTRVTSPSKHHMIAAYEPNALRPSNLSPSARVRYLHICLSSYSKLTTHTYTQTTSASTTNLTILPRTLVRRLTTTQHTNMPLVVPGIQSKDGKDDWMSKLMGKSIGDNHNETVRPFYHTQPSRTCPLYPFPCSCHSCNTSSQAWALCSTVDTT